MGTMPRFPYERIAPEANNIYKKMITAPDDDTADYWYDVYVSFLESTGWDPLSFDKETARRVDDSWDTNRPITWN